MNEYKYSHFDTPTQVMFYDHDGNHWIGGIGYKNEIICGCCGGIFEIAEIYEFAPRDIKDPILPYKDWLDIGAEIVGGEKPEGFEDNED